MSILTVRDKAVQDIVEQMERKREVDRGRKQKEFLIRKNWNALKKSGASYSLDDRAPALFDYATGRNLYDVVADDGWKDQRCFIIGGGESLKGFDFSKLKNELVIGINLAFKAIDCTINFAMDNNLYNWISTGRLGEETREKFEDFKGFRVWVDSAGYNYPKGIFILKPSNTYHLSRSMRDGIAGESNSGLGAVSLAVCLGANPIYLL